MIQIVFSDSECGSLKLAQHCGPSDGDGPIGVIFREDGRQPSPQEEERAMAQLRAQWEKENRRARPVGGDPGDVLCPSLGLDIGPVSGPDVEQARKNLLTAWLGEDFPLPEQDPDDHAQRDLLWESHQRDSAQLLERAGKGETVRIWYSPAPYSMCGFYDTVWRLRDCGCPVTVIELPRWTPMEDGTVVSCRSWGEVAPGDWAAYLPQERELTQSIRRAIAMEWEQLRRENAPLRAVVEGRLMSVGEDFYDGFIRAQVPKTPIRVGQLIGGVLGKYQLNVGDWWLAKRIQNMLELGELVLVREGDCFYRHELIGRGEIIQAPPQGKERL